MATELERVSFPIPKKGSAKECSNYCKTALISHSSKVKIKILEARPEQYMNNELPEIQAGVWKGRGKRDQIANINQIIEKAREFQKTSTSALLIIPKPLTVLITTTNVKFFKRWEYQTTDHLTCLLRNLYAGQDATVRTGHGTTDRFQIGKGVCQGCVLSPCLFNLYSEDIMQNAGLDEGWEKYQ